MKCHLTKSYRSILIQLWNQPSSLKNSCRIIISNLYTIDHPSRDTPTNKSQAMACELELEALIIFNTKDLVQLYQCRENLFKYRNTNRTDDRTPDWRDWTTSDREILDRTAAAFWCEWEILVMPEEEGKKIYDVFVPRNVPLRQRLSHNDQPFKRKQGLQERDMILK